LIAGGGGACGHVFKLRELFLGNGVRRDYRESNKQKQNQQGFARRGGNHRPWHRHSATRGAFCDGC
jgi:hypothetical protein